MLQHRGAALCHLLTHLTATLTLLLCTRSNRAHSPGSGHPSAGRRSWSDDHMAVRRHARMHTAPTALHPHYRWQACPTALVAKTSMPRAHSLNSPPGKALASLSARTLGLGRSAQRSLQKLEFGGPPSLSPSESPAPADPDRSPPHPPPCSPAFEPSSPEHSAPLPDPSVSDSIMIPRQPSRGPSSSARRASRTPSPTNRMSGPSSAMAQLNARLQGILDGHNETVRREKAALEYFLKHGEYPPSQPGSPGSRHQSPCVSSSVSSGSTTPRAKSPTALPRSSSAGPAHDIPAASSGSGNVSPTVRGRSSAASTPRKRSPPGSPAQQQSPRNTSPPQRTQIFTAGAGMRTMRHLSGQPPQPVAAGIPATSAVAAKTSPNSFPRTQSPGATATKVNTAGLYVLHPYADWLPSGGEIPRPLADSTKLQNFKVYNNPLKTDRRVFLEYYWNNPKGGPGIYICPDFRVLDKYRDHESAAVGGVVERFKDGRVVFTYKHKAHSPEGPDSRVRITNFTYKRGIYWQNKKAKIVLIGPDGTEKDIRPEFALQDRLPFEPTSNELA